MQKNDRENYAINSANIIAGVRGQNSELSTDTHGIAYDAKIAQVFYRFKDTSGSRNGIASDNSVDLSTKAEWEGYQPIYFEFENIKNITSGIIPKIHIDYVSVQTESGYYTIAKEFTPIRLTMCGSTRRDVKLWVGKFEEPFIEVDNFVDILNVTLNPYIKFGKLIPEAGASEWAWANLKFHVGHVIPPVISDVQEFHPSFRFPSTGGAGEIVKHAGTIWCITDGVYIRKSTDNPNDHTFKTWKYIPEEELWRYQSPTAPLIRVAGKQAKGNIKVFTAISYRNGLVAAGQVAEVGNPNPRPEES